MLQFLLGRRRNWGEVIICRGNQLLMGKVLWSTQGCSLPLWFWLDLFCALEMPDLLWGWGVIFIGFTKQGCCTPSPPGEKGLPVQQKYSLPLAIQLYPSFVPIVTLSSQGHQRLPMGHILSLCRCFQRSWFVFTARRTFNFKSKRKYWIT